jgi:hypothetical protein
MDVGTPSFLGGTAETVRHLSYPSSGAWLAGFASLKNKTPHGRTGYEVLSTTFILLDRVVRYDKSPLDPAMA